MMVTFYAIYGLSSLISMLLPIEDASLAAVVASLFAAVFGGYVQSLPEGLKKMSYAYWYIIIFIGYHRIYEMI